MSNKIGVTVNGTHKIGNDMFITIDGKHRHVKQAFLTVNGVHRECFCSSIASWDISASGDGSVMATLYNDSNNSGKYTLDISGVGDMTSSWSSSSTSDFHNSAYKGNITSVTIGEGVTNISKNAFRSMTSLTSVTISHTVKSIGDWAFRDCTNLSGGLIIPGNVDTIKAYAFQNCSSLTSVTFCDGVKTIGSASFWGTGVKNVIIPTSVTTFGSNIFANAPLTDVYYTGTYDQFKAIGGENNYTNNAVLITANFHSNYVMPTT